MGRRHHRMRFTVVNWYAHRTMHRLGTLEGQSSGERKKAAPGEPPLKLPAKTEFLDHRPVTSDVNLLQVIE
jgi:hypothetical protein